MKKSAIIKILSIFLFSLLSFIADYSPHLAVFRRICLGGFAVFRQMFEPHPPISTKFILAVLSISTKFPHAFGQNSGGYSGLPNSHYDFHNMPIRTHKNSLLVAASFRHRFAVRIASSSDRHLLCGMRLSAEN